LDTAFYTVRLQSPILPETFRPLLWSYDFSRIEIYVGQRALRARCKSTSTQSSNDSDGVPLAVALANWFRGSHID
jgi:hypothetical protein